MNSSFRNNRAIVAGGLLASAALSQTILLNLDISNSTFSGNHASDQIGGLWLKDYNISLNFVTISDNEAGANYGGLRIDTELPNIPINNSVIAGNRVLNPPPFEQDTIIDFLGGSSVLFNGGYNHIGAATEGFSDPNLPNTVGTVTSPIPAFMGPVADNGGPTGTNLPSATSSVIDAIPIGVNGCESGTGAVTTDQRGSRRAKDGNGDGIAGCDKGAAELGQLVCGIQAAAEPLVYDFFTGSDAISINVASDGSNFECLMATDIPFNHASAPLTIRTGKYWLLSALQGDLTTQATSDYLADLTFPFATADAFDKVCRFDGGNIWNCAASSFLANTSVTRTGVSQFSPWAVQNLAPPTFVSVSGRVLNANGRPISRAQVSITDSAGNVRTTLTNRTGHYSFDGVQTQETYDFDARAKRLVFATQIVFVDSAISDLNFVAGN